MTLDRRALRAALVERYPLVRDPDVGPSSVEAGECDRCGVRPRVVATCGPVAWAALCVRCADDVAGEAWCDGHADDAVTWRSAMAAWPDEHETVTRLWWVATGEVSLDVLVRPVADDALPDAVRAWLDGRA